MNRNIAVYAHSSSGQLLEIRNRIRVVMSLLGLKDVNVSPLSGCYHVVLR